MGAGAVAVQFGLEQGGAEPILLRLAAARADVTRMTTAPAAALLIGVTPLAGAASALAAVLARLRQRRPRLDVTIRVTTRGAAAAAVARGELDLALTDGLTDGLTAQGDPLPELAPVTAIGLGQVPVRVVLPPGHPLASQGHGLTLLPETVLRQAELITAPLLTTVPVTEPRLRHRLELLPADSPAAALAALLAGR